MFDELRLVLNTVTDLPPMPPVAARVLALMREDKSTARDLAALISSDPAVTARIIKIANSAFYSLPRQVKTLDHAIVVLGEKVLRSLVMLACLKGLNKSFGTVERLLWEDAVGCAAAARLVARRLGCADSEEAFLGGLFRNLGKLVMNNMDAPRYQDMMEEAGHGDLPLDQLERRYFPFPHMLIGAAVLAKWKFPENLTYVVRYYNDPVGVADGSSGLNGLMAAVNLADDFCRRLGIGRPQPEQRCELEQIPGAQLLVLDRRRLEPILNEFAEIYQRDRDLMLD
jgi:HD-like signal output (HDOD) protein